MGRGSQTTEFAFSAFSLTLGYRLIRGYDSQRKPPKNAGAKNEGPDLGH